MIKRAVTISSELLSLEDIFYHVVDEGRCFSAGFFSLFICRLSQRYCCSLREVFYFLVSYGVARGVSAGRDTKGGRIPGAPFRVKPQVFCLYALTVTKKLTGLREKANFKRSTVLFNMY